MFEEKFEPKTFNDVLDFIEATPAGKIATSLLSVWDSGGKDLHITLFFRVISAYNASLIWNLQNAIRQAFEPVDVVIGDAATFKSILYPQAKIMKVAADWKPEWLTSVLSRFNVRPWVPHVTFKTGVVDSRITFREPQFTLAYGENDVAKLRSAIWNALEKGFGDYLGIPKEYWGSTSKTVKGGNPQ